MAETNKEVFYQVVSGDKILPVYDVDAHARIAAATASVNELSGKVITLSGELKTASGSLLNDINTVDGKVDALSGEFTAHLNDYAAYKISVHDEFVNTSSWANQTFQPVGDYVSASDFTTYQQQVSDKFDAVDADLAKKLYTSATTDWDILSYTGTDGVLIENHIISVTGDYVDHTYLSAHYYNKDQVDEAIANFGGFQKAEWDAGHNCPAVANPKPNIIYLVKRGSTQQDPYYEWIWSDPEGWECIGEMSVPLEDYYTKTDCDERFQPVGNYASADDLANYYTTTEIDEKENTLRNDIENAYGDLFNAYVIGGHGIKVTSATSADDIRQASDVIYTVETDTDKYTWGVYSYEEETYSTTTTLAMSGTQRGDNIHYVNDQVILDKGVYHIDAQVVVSVSGDDPNYYDVVLSVNPGTVLDKKPIDASFNHAETLAVSYDIDIIADNTPLVLTLDGLPAGAKYTLKNLNIHEVLTLDSTVEALGGLYNAGSGLSLASNNTFQVNAGSGLAIDENNNKMYVVLGDGLEYTEKDGIKVVSVNNTVEAVVNTVNELKDDLDTKITNNFPPAMITMSNESIVAGDSQINSNFGILIGNLFTVPINHKIIVDETVIGIYCYQNDGNSKAMLGIYEYDPNANDGTGSTRALCDTGIIVPRAGYYEYPIKHVLNTDVTEGKMKPGCMYYASIFLGFDRTCGDTGMRFACVPGYTPQFNNLNPVLTVSQNHISAGLNQSYSEGLTFNSFGFGWYYNNYTNPEAGETRTDYHEAYSTPRFYMQIRNLKQTQG